MIIDAGNEDRPAFTLAAVDQIAVLALVAANVLPLLWWGQVEGWAHKSLALYIP